jgi:sulfatase maturation enzyme AslB (radical SAM superfamily)
MTNGIYLSKVVDLIKLDNLFIEMSAKSCNQRCKHCYIDFPMYKKDVDYIPVDTIKQALNDTGLDNIKCIYLTGAEPMTHPDFNAILRLCLKRTNVCICTNGSFINEKKARFLKKVEDESVNSIIFKISIDHYDEVKNDDARYRGAYRHGIFAIKHLVKYDFNTFITVTNSYSLPEPEIVDGFRSAFMRYDINFSKLEIQINPWFDKNADDEDNEFDLSGSLDCENGRILTANGVFTCPFLADDYRGRCGSSFADYKKRCFLETPYCNTCAKSSKPLFGLNFQ